MRFVDGKPEIPEHDPFLPVSRSVAAQKYLVETDSTEELWRVTLCFADIDVQDVRLEVTEQKLLICSQAEPPIREVLEAPRCLKPDTLKVQRGEDSIRVEVHYQENPCLPLAPSPGGPYRGEDRLCVEHPRSTRHEDDTEEHHIAFA